MRYYSSMVNVAFTGGGTGGHVYPGLAVARSLKERFSGQGCRVFWIGSDRGMERAIVLEAGLEFFGVPAGKLRRYFSLRTLPDAFRVAAGFFAARRILKKQKAVLLFSKGGFVSVPPCAAAASLGIPVFTHESDFSPGLATRINLRFVRKTAGKVFVSYAGTASSLSGRLPEGRVAVSGNPVRRDFRSADASKGRAFLGLGLQERILLVLGGSQGAAQVNALVSESLESLCLHYTVVHQCGRQPEQDLQRRPGYIPLAYIGQEMPHILAAAELVLGRSGAGTVWESAVLGKPMILIPLSGSGTRGDQVENARFFEKEGAALVFAGKDATAGNICGAAACLAGDSQKRENMAAASKRIGCIDGAEIIADSIAGMLKPEKENGV